MRRLILLPLLALWSSPALADPAPVVRPAAGPSVTDAGLPLPPTPAQRAGLYHGDVFTIGNDRVNVVISQGGDPTRPARWIAVDEAGRVAWEADHTCPDFAGLARLDADGDRLICKLPHAIVGVDAGDGAEVWRLRSDRKLLITGMAGGRVATSVDNEEVLVLDAADGREVGRWDVDGAVLEAVAATPDGPVALMITSPRDGSSRLETFEIGGEKLEVVVSGESPARRMGALPIGGPPWREAKPMQLSWSVQFEGYSFDLLDSGGVVVGTPREGVQVGYDITTGKQLWERRHREGEAVVFGDQGAAFYRRDGDAGYVYGALDPRTLRPLWERPWPYPDRPSGLAQGSGQVGAWAANVLIVARLSDGAALGEIAVAEGAPLVAASTSPSAIVWVAGAQARRVHFRTLAPER